MPFIDSQGVNLYYEETGSGPALIWIHEFAADCRSWEGQVRRFSRDYRCVTYNARGYPPSDVPEHGDAYTYAHHRDDILRLMNALGIERAHLVGLSMGAYSALRFAMEYPHRTLSVVFSSGGSGAPTPEYQRETGAGADRILSEGMASGADSVAFGPTRVQLLNKDPRAWAEFRAQMSEHSALGSALTLRNFQARRPSLRDDVGRLAQLDVPVLLAAGDEDDPVLEITLFLKRTLPRAGLWVHPRTGHAMNLEEPAEYNARIAEFLAAVELGTWRRRDHRARPGASVFSDHRTSPDA